MECYKCGALLGTEDNCPRCGVNVKMYKKLVATSNYFYNIGLERARVRNLTGAMDALKISLQFNKVNIQARNLLGLIYYEIGETVSALSEWVISKNCQEKENPADRYLADVQNNPTMINATNQSIKKFNQALAYCRQDSKDLAIIQLKKMTSSYPKLLKAHQLLALLYIDAGKYDQAGKALRNAEKIDRNNTITMRYQAEVRAGTEEKSAKKKRKKKETTVEYHTGNDTIIQPTNLRDNTGRMMIINILAGLLIGVAVTYFLIVPSIRQQIQKSTGAEVADANDTIADRNQTIQDLESQISQLEQETQEAKDASASAQTKIESYEKVIEAYQSYHNGELQAAGDLIGEVDESQLGLGVKQIYETMKTEVETKYLETAYAQAYSKYMGRNYREAAQELQTIVDMDETYHDGDAIYYLAQAYRIIGEYEKAKTLYEKVIAEYANTYKANNSKQYLQEVLQKLNIQ